MNRREVQQDIKRLASRAVGQANINATKLRTIAFPLPPSLNEQAEIIAILDALDRKLDLHRRKREVLDQLFKSLLYKLMTGEISVYDLDLSALPANDGERRMSQIKISEAKSVQFPMVKHASAVGWGTTHTRGSRRHASRAGQHAVPQVLEDKLRQFNPWLSEDQARAIVESIEALPATIEGNREVLRWLRGERQWNDENEHRHRPVQVVDFANPIRNALHVTWGGRSSASGAGEGQPSRCDVRR